MAQLLSFTLLTVSQFIIGRSIMRLLKVDDDFRITLPLSFMLGIGILSTLPFLLELLHISIIPSHVFVFIGITTGLACIPLVVGRKSISWPHFIMPRLYNLPFLIVIGLIIFLSVWRCYYNPVTPRDMLSGPEVIADYTLKEHTMVNSVYSLDLFMNNNQFKPPSIISLQVIYKMAGFPFGQVWLSTLFICFIVILYQIIIKRLHSLIAGILILSFLAIPEMYAYTYMVLFDYPNAVFFTLSCYFLFRYFDSNKLNWLLFAGLLMGMATYFRAETLILACMLFPAILMHSWRNKIKLSHTAILPLLYLILPAIAYWLPNSYYNNYYLPVHYDIAGLVNQHPFQPGPLIERFKDMNTRLIFGDYGITLYGYFTYIFLAFTLLELILYRGLTKEGRNWQYVVLVVFFGLPLLGFLLPLMDLMNTTKRGLFKLFPPMLLYLANCRPLIQLSAKITNWEMPAPKQPNTTLTSHQPKKAGSQKAGMPIKKR